MKKEILGREIFSRHRCFLLQTTIWRIALGIFTVISFSGYPLSETNIRSPAAT